MFTTTRPAREAGNSDLYSLVYDLRYFAGRSWSAYLGGDKRLLHNIDFIELLDTRLGTDPEQRVSRLEDLFSVTTGLDYDFAALRQASVRERRQALGLYAETFAVFEDLREGRSGARRHAKEFSAMPLELPKESIARAHFKPYRPPLAPPLPANVRDGHDVDPYEQIPTVSATAPIPAYHVRFARQAMGMRPLYVDVPVHLDAMTVQEAVNLMEPQRELPPKFKALVFLDNSLKRRVDTQLTLREAGIAYQTQITVYLIL